MSYGRPPPPPPPRKDGIREITSSVATCLYGTRRSRKQRQADTTRSCVPSQSSFRAQMHSLPRGLFAVDSRRLCYYYRATTAAATPKNKSGGTILPLVPTPSNQPREISSYPVCDKEKEKEKEKKAFTLKPHRVEKAGVLKRHESSGVRVKAEEPRGHGQGKRTLHNPGRNKHTQQKG